jgi:hypothetical protein
VTRNEISGLSLKVLEKAYTNQNLESMLNEVSKDSKLDLKKKDKKILKALKGNSSSAEVIRKLKKQSVEDKKKISEHQNEIKRLKFINFKQRINFEVKIDSKSYKNDYVDEQLLLESSGNNTTNNNNKSKDDDDDDKDFADIDAMIIPIPEKEYREKLEFQTKCGLKFDYLKIFEDREKKLTILNKNC